MRIMYDGVTPSRLPGGGDLYAGYVNGKYVWTAEDWARFPHAGHVHIDVNGTHPDLAGVLDVERGDATVRDVRPWVQHRHSLGHRSVIYCSRAVRPAIKATLKGETVSWWIADWTNHAHHVVGAIAVQYQNTPGYDISAVYDNSWHRRA